MYDVVGVLREENSPDYTHMRKRRRDERHGVLFKPQFYLLLSFQWCSGFVTKQENFQKVGTPS